MDITVKIPRDLLQQIDLLVTGLAFGSREAFVEAAIRRLIDHYAVALPSPKTHRNLFPSLT